MRVLRGVGVGFWRFMVVFSFVVNLVLVSVVLVLALLLFQIKNAVAAPLLTGLHSSFVGLDEAVIDWTIPVRDTVPVQFTLPLQQNTIVTLTEPVPLVVAANIVLPGVGNLSNAQVALTLPRGLELPVALDLQVPVDQQLDIALDVRAVIPLDQTQLHDPFVNLRLTFEPLLRALGQLPNSYGQVPGFVSRVLGDDVAWFAEDDYARAPWPGFSRTAGLNYALAADNAALNAPAASPLGAQSVSGDGADVVLTGLVPEGGIPALDEPLRPDLYADGQTPRAQNDAATDAMIGQGVPARAFRRGASTDNEAAPPPASPPPAGDDDMGILGQ